MSSGASLAPTDISFNRSCAVAVSCIAEWPKTSHDLDQFAQTLTRGDERMNSPVIYIYIYIFYIIYIYILYVFHRFPPWYILRYFLSDKCSDILRDILSHIISHHLNKYIYIYRHLIWHFIGHSISHSIWHIWRFLKMGGCPTIGTPDSIIYISLSISGSSPPL